MRRVFHSLSLLGLFAVLTFGSLGLASAAPGSNSVVPQIVGASSVGLCSSTASCKVTATLTYNVPVAVWGNAVPDFTVEDVTNEQVCSVLAVTTVPPPTPVVPPPALNALYLTMSCVVSPGDTMVLVYRQSPSLTAGYVYSVADPTVHARSPQAFAWFESPLPAPPPG